VEADQSESWRLPCIDLKALPKIDFMTNSQSPVDPQERYDFGRNWAKFSKAGLDDEARKNSREWLLRSLKLRSLEGRVFLDIGSGSGLHSLAAYQSGASEVISFDYDPHSVATTEKIRVAAGSPANWQVLRGSVLDGAFMQDLPKADIVYSWGVLHHTGHVWEALRNAFVPLKPGGLALVALYSTTCYENAALHGWPSPEKWLQIKQRYNRASSFQKLAMEWHYVLTSGFGHSVWRLRTVFRSCLRALKESGSYRAKRGMHYWTDVRDWLGGWPMEFVHENDVLQFCDQKFGLEWLDMRTGEGCTEYLLQKQNSKADWHPFHSKEKRKVLAAPYNHKGGFAWEKEIRKANQESEGTFEKLQLLENGRPLIKVGEPYEDSIRQLGRGRYMFKEKQLIFSSSDCTDPNGNGKTYEIRKTHFSS